MAERNEAEIAHLGMIQGVINRMASNSFSLKALAVTIAAAVIALAGTQQNTSPILSFAGLLPVLVFWLLDAKYLRLEKLYRELFDHVRKGGEIEPFSMRTQAFDKQVPWTIQIAFSWSVVWFYTAVALVLIVVACLSRCNVGS